MRIAVIFFLMMAMGSCKRECTKVVDTYQNGKQKIVRVFPKCGNTDRYTEYWYYENGQLESEQGKIFGKANGVCKSWYENGVLSAEWRLSNDKGDGVFRCYNEKGNLIRQGYSERGLKQGIVKDWLEGETYLEHTYKNGLLEGAVYQTSLDSSGKRYIIIGGYENDKQEGLWQRFDADSVLVSSETYVRGEVVEIRYYDKGKLIRTKKL